MDVSSKKPVIEGPVFPICPAFSQDGALDLTSTSYYVDYLLSRGARTLMVTVGTSRFNLLRLAEMQALNKLVVNACTNRAMSIVATPAYGSTADVASQCRDLSDAGADAILVHFPERYYDEGHLLDFFSQVGSACGNSSLMVHANPMRCARTGGAKVYDVDLVKKMKHRIPNFGGLKEESGDGEVKERLVLELGSETSIVLAGAAMQSFMSVHELGARSFLAGVGSFVPDIEINFYQNFRDHGVNSLSQETIEEIEKPFFEIAKPCGWHAAMKCGLALFRLMPLYERRPMRAVSIDEARNIHDALKKTGISAMSEMDLLAVEELFEV